MNAPTKVAFIVNSLRFGGAEKHTVQLFNSLPAEHFQPALAYLKLEEHLLPEADLARGTVWCAHFGNGWDFAGLRRLAGWVKSTRPDVLVCVNTYPLFYGHLARRLAGQHCRIVEIFHSTKLYPREDWKMRWIYRPFFNYSDCIVYVSTAQRSYWEARGLRPDRAQVIHNGIDTVHFCDRYPADEKTALRERFGFAADDFVIGICAALRPEKQHEDLIEAIARLKAEGLPAKCLIIGDGPRRAAIEEMITRSELGVDVAITGYQTDVRPYIAACDCMTIVSTHRETLSIAALESMALGKPMVMSAIGGAAEQVINGENGYLFPPSDVVALTTALRKLADPEHANKLGGRARAMVTRYFDVDDMAASYARLLGAIG